MLAYGKIMTRTGSEEVQSGNWNKSKLQAEWDLEMSLIKSRGAKENWNKRKLIVNCHFAALFLTTLK